MSEKLHVQSFQERVCQQWHVLVSLNKISQARQAHSSYIQLKDKCICENAAYSYKPNQTLGIAEKIIIFFG